MMNLVLGRGLIVWRVMRTLLLLGILALVGFSTTRNSAAQAPEIDWRNCGDIECGTMDVPLDYGDPESETIELALIRIEAREPSRRIGVLMANPGGPGGSALDFVSIWRSLLDGDIRDRFDIVAFDPRGVGESTPVLCHDRLQELVAIDPDPDTDAEWEEAKEISRLFAEDCADAAGDLLPHVGTKNVARDMDLIRESLGEEQINYVGYSYGTTIGSVYADMFPERVRAMVLDGGTDLSLPYEEVSLTQIIGFERALTAFLAWCEEEECEFAEGSDPRTALEEVIAISEEEPIPAPGADRDAGPGEVSLGIISALYSQFSWPQLARALDEALDGDGTRLVDLVDNYLQRDGDGDYPNLIEANSAVNNVDGVCSKDPDAYRALGEEFEREAPTFGRLASTMGLVCAYWDVEPDPLETPRAAGAPPMIVIATTNDPATPYEWGKALSEQLESAVLVTYRGEGHTIYAQGSGCIDDVVDAYLLTLAMPAEGTTCGNGPPPPDGSNQPGGDSTPPSEGDPTSTPGSPSTGQTGETPGPSDNGSEGPAQELGSTTGYWIAAIILLVITLALLAVAFINTRRR